MQRFKEIMFESDIAAGINKVIRVFNGPQMKMLVKSERKGDYYKVVAEWGGFEVGSIWVRDHGQYGGLDFSEPEGIFKQEGIYETLRRVMEKK